MKKTIVVSLFLLLALFSCKQKHAEIVQPKYAPITELVFAPGTLEAEDQFVLYALNDGYITEISVTEGDHVHAGDVLIRQENPNADIQLKAAKGNLKIAEELASSNSALIRQLQFQLQTAETKLHHDQQQLERLKRLLPSKAVSQSDADDAQLLCESDLSNVEMLRESIKTTQLEQQQALINSRSQEALSSQNLAYSSITSDGDFVVYKILKKKGELTRKGEPVAILGRGNSFVIKLNVDEDGIDKVSVNQRVYIELNTNKGKLYDAVITRIYPAFDETSQSYETEAKFIGNVPELINGTLLQANIVTAKKNKALLIPRECLNPNNEVLVKKKRSEFDTVTIQTGIVSTDWVEVLHGVSINDQLAKTW